MICNVFLHVAMAYYLLLEYHSPCIEINIACFLQSIQNQAFHILCEVLFHDSVSHSEDIQMLFNLYLHFAQFGKLGGS